MIGTSNKKIAILGATSHIAKGLIHGFCLKEENELFLFGRSPDRINSFLANLNDKRNAVQTLTFSEFTRGEYDVVINCVGIGDPGKLKSSTSSIFKLTETYDNLVLEYLEGHPKTLYINFSSGAVYGTDFASPVDATTHYTLGINNISAYDYYGITKLHSEAKHRALPMFNIVDLRVFSYFSRYIDLQSKFLLSDILLSIKKRRMLETSSDDIIRDYVHRDDLLSILEICQNKKVINTAFDIYSLQPASKFEILDFFSREYGLSYTVKETAISGSPTGNKKHYYSINKKAEEIGYSPRFTSLECIVEESKCILAGL